MSEFKNQTLLITGGTGSFGRACLDRFLKGDIAEIRIFSRDETKQDEMRHLYADSSKIKYYIGDIRDYESILEAMSGVDYVFHAAALKEVPSCEFFPIEAVKTNILGADNVAKAAVACGVKALVGLSTDKAAYPINAMGMSKALMEKSLIARARTIEEGGTLISLTRYGNVLCSRGSVVPLFIQQILSGKALTITEPKMTRFLMSLDEAIDLVEYAFTNAKDGDLFVRKAPASTIGDLAEAVRQLFHGENEIRYIGKRHGEKMYETLLTDEEMQTAEDQGLYFRVPTDSRDLNYDQYYVDGIDHRTERFQFNSDNATRLNVEEIKALLLKQPYVRAELQKAGLLP